MGHLSLAFLGTPQVRHRGQVVTFSTRKTLALLIYLTTEGGLHTREAITTLFWPESGAKRARAAMRRTLSYLRAALGGEQHLIIEGADLGFEFTSEFDLDLHTLDTAWNLVRVPPRSMAVQDDSRRHLLARLQEVAGLYRGDFLGGFSLPDAPDFDGWASLQREVWHRQLDLILDRLSQLQSEGGDIEGALETTARWVAHHPLNEAAHRRLMQLHFAAGDRAAALNTFENCRAILAEELDVQPAPETIALAERIHAQVPPRRARRSLAQADQIPALPDDPPFVGRALEHSRLVVAYHNAARGQPQIVVIEGEAGIGKTRLAREFLAWAAAQGADVVQGRAFETGGSLPYQPLVQALRPRLEQENAPDDLLHDIWLTELSRLLPELLERYPDLPAPGFEETASQTRIFEAVTRLGGALAARAPLVLLIDDLQWADPASLDLLQYALRGWKKRNAPALLLFTVRPEELAPASTQSTGLLSLERDLALTHLRLGPITADATKRLVQILAGEQRRRGAVSQERDSRPRGAVSLDTNAFSQWLFAETNGQPLYAIETLKGLVEQGMLRLRPSGRSTWAIDLEASLLEEILLHGSRPVPPGVQQVIRARVERLSPNARTACIAGAVLGDGFDFEQMRGVAGMDENEALPVLDELLARGLLFEGVGPVGGDVSPGRLYFTHDKIRAVVYAQTSEMRRRIFHRRALEALQAASAPAAELAHHALAAGLAKAAFRFSLQAGDEALRLFAVNVAILHYEQARRILSGPLAAAPVALSQAGRLYQQLGRAYELHEDFEEAQEVFQTMLTFARERGDAQLEWAALNHLATLITQGPHDFESALALLKESQAIAEKSGDITFMAETEWNLAQVNFYRFAPQASLLHGHKALSLAREGDLPEVTARCLNVIAYAETVPGNWGTVEEFAAQAHAKFAELGNRALEADSLSLVGKARLNLGRTQAGIEAAKAALTISQEIDNTWGQANCAKHLAFGYLERGEYGRALTLVQEGEAIARKALYPLLLVFNLIVKGNIYRAIRALDDAQAAHQEALSLNETLPMQPFTKTLAGEKCADCALAGKWDEAHTCARQALAARDITMIHSGLTHWLDIEALLRGGDVELATEETHRFGERFGDNPRYRIVYSRCLAVLAEWDRDIDRAIAHLQEALTLAQEIGLPGEQWQILAELGELYQAKGDGERARQAFEQAAEIVRSLAAKIEDDELQAGFLAAVPVRQVLAKISTEPDPA